MKRVGYLFDKIYNFNNLVTAYKNATRRKKKRKEVKDFCSSFSYNISKLQEQIKNKSYKPSKCTEFEFIDKCSKKLRKAQKPALVDLIVDWAVIQVIEPIIFRGLDRYTCSNVEGRGGLYAMKRVEHAVRVNPKGTKWCLKCDVDKFYASIDRGVLLDRLSHYIKDKDVLELLATIIGPTTEKGLSIGKYHAQILAVFYLLEIFPYLRQGMRVKYVYAYCDDIVILGSNKRRLRKVLKDLEAYLGDELKLSLNEDKQIFKVGYRDKFSNNIRGRPIDFCGYKVYRKYTTIRKRIFKNFRRSVFKLKRCYTLERCKSFTSYIGYVLYTASTRLKHIYYNLVSPSWVKRLISLFDKGVFA